MAAQRGHVDVVRELLEAGFNVNATRTDIGASALTVAAENGLFFLLYPSIYRLITKLCYRPCRGDSITAQVWSRPQLPFNI